MAPLLTHCPQCGEFLDNPPIGEKFRCGNCGQKIRIRAGAAGLSAGDGQNSGEQPEGVESLSFFWGADAIKKAAAQTGSAGETGSKTVSRFVDGDGQGGEAPYFDDDPDDDFANGQGPDESAPPGPAERSSAELSLDDARSLWADAVKPGDSEGQSLRGGRGSGTGAGSAAAASVSDSVTLFVRSLAAPAAGTGQQTSRSDLELREKIGQGGMGIVFAARQAALNRRVAVKVIDPDRAGRRGTRQKFIAEAVVTGALDHPNIVPVYDLGVTDDNTLFYSMKEVKGRPWSEIMADRPPGENLDIFLKVCEAVAYAHDHGVIHRDIKPDNVMVGDYGEVLLMDWGLAVAVDDRADPIAEKLSDVNARNGTPAYMAPEMARGDTAAIGAASDIYLLGGCLYEMTAGVKPHHGDSVFGCIFHAMKGRLQPTARKGELINIARRALAKIPADRFPSVKNMIGVLREYQTHRDSIEMARAATELLAKGRENAGYDELSRALFGFEEAARLWESNGNALNGAARARLFYAQRALERRDYDLARSLALPLTRDALERECEEAPPERQPLLRARNNLWNNAAGIASDIARDAEAGRRQIAARLKREKILFCTAAALIAVVAVVASVAYARIEFEKRQAGKAVSTAERSREEAAQAVADLDRLRAEARDARQRIDGQNSALEKAAAEIERQRARAAWRRLEAVQARHRARAESRRAEDAVQKLAQRQRDFANAMHWITPATDGDDAGAAGGTGGESPFLSTLAEARSLLRAIPGAVDEQARFLNRLARQARRPDEIDALGNAFLELGERAHKAGRCESAARAFAFASWCAELTGDRALSGRVREAVRATDADGELAIGVIEGDGFILLMSAEGEPCLLTPDGAEILVFGPPAIPRTAFAGGAGRVNFRGFRRARVVYPLGAAGGEARLEITVQGRMVRFVYDVALPGDQTPAEIEIPRRPNAARLRAASRNVHPPRNIAAFAAGGPGAEPPTFATMDGPALKLCEFLPPGQNLAGVGLERIFLKPRAVDGRWRAEYTILLLPAGASPADAFRVFNNDGVSLRYPGQSTPADRRDRLVAAWTMAEGTRRYEGRVEVAQSRSADEKAGLLPVPDSRLSVEVDWRRRRFVSELSSPRLDAQGEPVPADRSFHAVVHGAVDENDVFVADPAPVLVEQGPAAPARAGAPSASALVSAPPPSSATDRDANAPRFQGILHGPDGEALVGHLLLRDAGGRRYAAEFALPMTTPPSAKGD